MITRSLLKKLLNKQSEYVTSIYLPTHEAAVKELEQDRIRLRNLLDQAENDLCDVGFDPREARQRLAKIRELQNDFPFWQHQKQGLAIFIGPKDSEWYHLPLSVPEISLTSKRFHIKPLVPFFETNQLFHILKLSLNEVELYKANLEGIWPIESESIPANITDALGIDDPERQLQNHVADNGGLRVGSGGAIFHGHGGAKDIQDVDPPRFIKAVFDGVHKEINGSKIPLLFAGDDQWFALYKQLNPRHELLPENLHGNFDATPPQELHKQALAVACPYFEQHIDSVLGRLQELEAKKHKRAAHGVEEVVKAALAGKVEHLFYHVKSQVWGQAEGSQKVTTLKERRPGADDLLDIAISHTYAHGGEVHPMEDIGELKLSPAAAILRY